MPHMRQILILSILYSIKISLHLVLNFYAIRSKICGIYVGLILYRDLNTRNPQLFRIDTAVLCYHAINAELDLVT